MILTGRKYLELRKSLRTFVREYRGNHIKTFYDVSVAMKNGTEHSWTVAESKVRRCEAYKEIVNRYAELQQARKRAQTVLSIDFWIAENKASDLIQRINLIETQYGEGSYFTGAQTKEELKLPIWEQSELIVARRRAI